jgi:hypothetical protein
MRTVVLLILSIVLTGCSIGEYQAFREGHTLGGYTDGHLVDNVYYVRASVSVYLKPEMAVQNFSRRAKEVCIANGYRDYQEYRVGDAGVPGLHGAAPPIINACANLTGRCYDAYVLCINP